jgi:formate/nitrite transporter FocA (FNT family)
VGVVGASLFPLGLTVVVLLGGLLLMALPLYLAYRPAVDED